MAITKHRVPRTLAWLIVSSLFISCQTCSPNQKDGNGPEREGARVLEGAKPNHQLPPEVTLIQEKSGVIELRSRQFISERLDHPGLLELRAREKLDEVIAPGRDEFEKMRLLCDWVNRQWEHGNPVPYPRWDANVILSMIRSGKTGGFCAQYAVVFCQCCLSLGWQARYLDVLPDRTKPGGGHFTVEVWSNQYNKWILLDPSYNCWFGREGEPLSGLEVHEALLAGDMESVRVIRGNSRSGLAASAADQEIISKFFYLAADMRTDHLSHPFHFWNRQDTYLSWNDLKTNDRHPICKLFTSDPADFNFPLNQVHVQLKPGSLQGELICYIQTNMPDMETLMIRHDDGPWIKPPSPFNKNQRSVLKSALSPFHGQVLTYHWKLKPGGNKIRVRAVNRLGVAGPASFLWVNYLAG